MDTCPVLVYSFDLAQARSVVTPRIGPSAELARAARERAEQEGMPTEYLTFPGQVARAAADEVHRESFRSAEAIETASTSSGAALGSMPASRSAIRARERLQVAGMFAEEKQGQTTWTGDPAATMKGTRAPGDRRGLRTQVETQWNPARQSVGSPEEVAAALRQSFIRWG